MKNLPVIEWKETKNDDHKEIPSWIYRLDGEEVVPINCEKDIERDLSVRIKETTITNSVLLFFGVKPTIVSTMFLSIDMSFGQSKNPVVFETMIFENNLFRNHGRRETQAQERYSTYREAVLGHELAVRIARERLSLRKVLKNRLRINKNDQEE